MLYCLKILPKTKMHKYALYSMYMQIYGIFVEYLSIKSKFFVNIMLAFHGKLLYSGFRFEF